MPLRRFAAAPAVLALLAAAAAAVAAAAPAPDAGGSGGGTGAGAGGAAVAAAADPRSLHTACNKIFWADGSPYFGRGVNLQDTRGCGACAGQQDKNEVIRRLDFAVKTMGATLLRLTMEAYAPTEEAWQYCTPADCAVSDAYLADLDAILTHAGTYPQVQVLISAWSSTDGWGMTDQEWPTNATNALWRKVVAAVGRHPHVWFGVTNEPTENFDGSQDDDVWRAMDAAVAAIRAQEAASGQPPHLVAVQGTRAWGRALDYYVQKPIAAGGGANVVYETHAYNPRDEFQGLVFDPAQTLPVIIGELGPDGTYMTTADAKALMAQATAARVPWLGWTLHMRCHPSMLVDKSKWGCGVGMPLKLTAWGKLVAKALKKRI